MRQSTLFRLPTTMPVIWLAWTLLSGLAAAGAFLFAYFVSHLSGVNEDQGFVISFLPMLAVLTPAAQYPVLVLRIPRPWGWLVASFLGWAVGFGLVTLASGLLPHPMNASLGVVLGLFGLAVGTAQWIYLRRRLAYTAWWTPATLLGFALLALIGGRAFSNIWQLALIGLVPNAINGVLLGLILTNQPEAGPSFPESQP